MALLMAFGIGQDVTPSSTKCPGKSHRGIRFKSDGTNARALRREQKARPDPSLPVLIEQKARPDPSLASDQCSAEQPSIAEIGITRPQETGFSLIVGFETTSDSFWSGGVKVFLVAIWTSFPRRNIT